jgi:serine-type D-Ala-D-Ala carboxypeptidase/endopeptidase (penicillin-binding protein 4)
MAWPLKRFSMGYQAAYFHAISRLFRPFARIQTAQCAIYSVAYSWLTKASVQAMRGRAMDNAVMLKSALRHPLKALLSLAGLFSCVFAAPALHAQDALPPAFTQALARAGVPREAVSVLVQAIAPTSPTSPTTPNASATDTAATLGPRLAHRATASVNPASVMKLITTYAALDTLGPEYTWKNRVYVDGTISDGVLIGNLIIRGSGDPKLVLERIDELFKGVQAKGVREVRGDIILDRSIFNVPDKNPADFDDEPLRPYNAVPDGLLVNFKSLIFTFIPDIPNQRVLIQHEPPIQGVEIPSELPMGLGACGDWKSALRAEFLDANRIVFAGGYAASCGEKVWPVAYVDPRSYASRVIEAMWLASGGKLSGKVREEPLSKSAKLLHIGESLPLADIATDINKFSNNVMAQQVFLSLSARPFGGVRGSFEASQRAVAAWWKRRFPEQTAPVLDNGSGLSRRERASAASLNALLQHAAASPNGLVFANSMGIAGVDGTVARMRERNSNSPAIGQAQLKTGTLRDVAAVAGYANGASGQRYSVVAIINHGNAGAARPALDRLIEWVVQDR